MEMPEDSEDSIPEIFKNMPKIELHAHLNGSLSRKTLQSLVKLKKNTFGYTSEQDFESFNLAFNDLSGCFKLFDTVHQLTNHPEAIYMATCDVIEDFFNDGVQYLELRSTPKDNAKDMTQDVYVETVVKAIEHTCSKLHDEISVKLLLSVDRKRSLNYAEETVKCAEKYFSSSTTVVGIDLSGDPTKGNIASFMPILEYAKKIGLKLSTHISEVANAHEEEEQLIKLQPHRFGHGTFLHPIKGGSVENFSLLNEYKIPLEICLTSNMISKTVPSYEQHHFPLFMELGYPCTLCTDDKGVFNTTLSREYYLASKYYSLSASEVFNLAYKSIDYAFITDAEKEALKQAWNQRKLTLNL